MTTELRISDLGGTEERITVSGYLDESISLNRDAPLRKFFVEEESESEDRVAAVIYDDAETPELKLGTEYVFENVIDHRYDNPRVPYAPQIQIKADDESEIRLADDESGTDSPDDTDDDNDDDGSGDTGSGTDRHPFSSPGKDIRTDGADGERVSGHNPLNDSSRIKDAGLHQGSP